jgi:two-component system cell cycle sensor histidine kinase PleC
MSHELRTPLNSILGNSEIIQDKLFGSDINDEYVKCASKINKSGYKLLNLINDILIISKINSDKLKLGLQESNVNEIIKESIELISTEAKRKNIKITQNFINNCFINVDRQKIERVFNNILSNAVKFTNKNGEIKISITEDKNYIQIVVEDNGIGIKEGDIERILCEYECINNGFSRESREQGTGLGLPIVKKIVELHKGIFSINSIFGEGTKITIKLPK